MAQSSRNGKSAKFKNARAYKLALASVLLICAFAVVTYYVKSRLFDNQVSSDPALMAMIVGEDPLLVPRNTIRFSQQRVVGNHEKLDLMFLWPQMNGYSLEFAAAFETTGNESNLIFATLAPRRMAQDMSGRLEPVYAPLFEGAAKAGPNGLKLQTLRKGYGYEDEVLAIGSLNGRLWIARCDRADGRTAQTVGSSKAQIASPFCIRDVFLGRSLAATYRFPRRLLGKWQEIDTAIFRRLNTMLQ